MNFLTRGFQKSFVLIGTALALVACGAGSGPAPVTYHSKTTCWNGLKVTSAISQSAADSMVPGGCEALSAANLLSIALVDGTGVTTKLAAISSALELRNLPPGVLVASSSIFIRDTLGQTYSLTVSSEPSKLMASPSLPLSTLFTVVGGSLNLLNAPPISLNGKSFRTVFGSTEKCWNGDYLTSPSSQIVADHLVPQSCTALSIAEIAEIEIGVGVNLGAILPTPTLTLLKLPTGVMVSPSTLIANDHAGRNYSLGLTSNASNLTTTPQLPFATAFTLSSGTLNFTNAPSIPLSGRAFQTLPVPRGPTSIIASIAPLYYVGNDVSLDGSSSTAPESSIVSYEWAFGDGILSTGALVSHTYSAPGLYLVSLTVTDNFARRSSSTLTLNVTLPVYLQPPIAKVTPLPGAVPLLGYVAGSVMFLSPVGSTDPDGSIVSYFWEFGDGTTQFLSTADSVPHTFSASGTYIVKLTVTDNSGLSNSKSINLTINP
jgi:chitodextrinase